MNFAFALAFLQAFAFGAPIHCRNLDEVDSQSFPAAVELTEGKQGLTVKVTEKGKENAALARTGHRYEANRVAKAEEARYRVPTYYVTDNPEGDLFANEERDTAVYLFVEKKTLEGKGGRMKLWLHYSGGDYRGVEADKYACLSRP